jgi:thioredoxin-like negative regulator of GroEL
MQRFFTRSGSSTLKTSLFLNARTYVTSEHVFQVTESDFDQKVKKSTVPVLVDVYAE